MKQAGTSEPVVTALSQTETTSADLSAPDTAWNGGICLS
jgi:hypothetical protein